MNKIRKLRTIPNTSENQGKLKNEGYEKRAGSAAYPEQRVYLSIDDSKKWYWEDTINYNQ